GVVARGAETLTVGDLMGAADRFDEKDVALTGTAEHVQSRISHRGNEYTTFTLADQSGRVNVFSFGKLPIKSGERVQIRGTFRRIKRVGQYTFHDEIEASAVQRAN